MVVIEIKSGRKHKTKLILLKATYFLNIVYTICVKYIFNDFEFYNCIYLYSIYLFREYLFYNNF